MSANTADIVIIGGGIVGCATAYYLAQRGARVILLEKDDIAQEASGRNRGNVRVQLRDRIELPIALEALELWKVADRELGMQTEFRTTGNLLVTYHDSIANGFADEAAKHRQRGLDAHVVQRQDLTDFVPGISPDIVMGFLTTQDGHVNPQKATWAFATAALRRGVAARAFAARSSPFRQGSGSSRIDPRNRRPVVTPSQVPRRP